MVKVKSDTNGGSIIELARIKPSLVKIAIPITAILPVLSLVAAITLRASAKVQDVETCLDSVSEIQESVNVHARTLSEHELAIRANESCIQENRKMNRALLKQLALLCEKENVPILYDTEDFYEPRP